MRPAYVPLLLGAVAACGSASNDSLFAGGSSVGQSPSGGDAGASPASDAGPPPDAGVTSLVGAGGSLGGSGGSGMGGTDAGGASGSGGLNAGTGGTAMATGDSGFAGGGTAGQGGDKTDASTEPAPPPGAGLVRCGDSPCNASEGELCCLLSSGVLSGSSWQCTTDSTSCTQGSFQCDADNDCPDGRVCCYERRSVSLGPAQLTVLESTCRASCADAAPMACAQPTDCPAGQTCCGDLQGTPPLTVLRYDSFVCTDACPAADRVLCDSTDDCVIEGRVCDPSGVLPPGFSICE